MHIDAFFEYLTGKMPRYCTQIPPPHDPFPKNGRDGVPLEEDLAIRALDPSYRPKRGRKKTDDVMGDDDSTPPPKRPHLDTSFAFSTSTNPQSACPNSALPMSAHPDDFVSNDPWATATISTPSNLQRGLSPNSAMTAPGGAHIRWRLNAQDNPNSPHPLSAVSPMTGRPPDSAFDEPLSAVTPSTTRPRARRRHGPAVSSAWPSSSGGANGKLRGRPPANRSVRDGPYVTFPANPNTKEAPVIDLSRNTPGPTPVQERAQPETGVTGEQQMFRFPPTPASAVSTASAQPTVPASSGPGRGQRLSLQVPRRESGPVHLVTPTVLVNGESDDSASQGNATSIFDELTKAAGSMLPRITREDLRRSLAAELLRAEISNRKRLRGSEAKALAHALLDRLQAQNQGTSRSAVANNREEDEAIFGITCASWLGLAAPLGLGGNGIVGGTRKISVQRFRMSDDGYESPVDDDDDGASESTPGDGRKIKEVFDVSWSLLFGGCGGEFLVKGLILNSEGEGQDGETKDEGSEKSLEERVRALEAELRAKEQEMQRLRETVLGAVM
ncbi:uncharacterized protein K452DRAFT_283330 [Aplosporella prunicola CBS 121167]|uniref:Uncharacterized protein n=1 Tax=Aplosporella prunicola CBS 121167 TaxID=1176127 RepID=A0A6A6BRY0_9PEZI|nr:uncharacterized protein K452DRAFT_283330 [Aplosporella prunicola CBS 121167]KAF2146045.1 hypothetical protein K452DRAFT_283330 [Aplosporella prunicola CBS 121167]